jgi:hypothetical protein
MTTFLSGTPSRNVVMNRSSLSRLNNEREDEAIVGGPLAGDNPLFVYRDLDFNTSLRYDQPFGGASVAAATSILMCLWFTVDRFPTTVVGLPALLYALYVFAFDVKNLLPSSKPIKTEDKIDMAPYVGTLWGLHMLFARAIFSLVRIIVVAFVAFLMIKSMKGHDSAMAVAIDAITHRILVARGQAVEIPALLQRDSHIGINVFPVLLSLYIFMSLLLPILSLVLRQKIGVQEFGKHEFNQLYLVWWAIGDALISILLVAPFPNDVSMLQPESIFSFFFSTFLTYMMVALLMESVLYFILLLFWKVGAMRNKRSLPGLGFCIVMQRLVPGFAISAGTFIIVRQIKKDLIDYADRYMSAGKADVVVRPMKEMRTMIICLCVFYGAYYLSKMCLNIFERRQTISAKQTNA